MSETEHEEELTEPTITPVPEPDQDPDEEAAEAEPETAEEPSEEPAEAPEAQGPTQEEWEERAKQADSKFTTYTRAISRIYEEQATEYLPCPLCASAPAGFVHPQDVGQFPDDVQGAVMMLLGQTSAGTVNKDPYSEVCDICDGWGVVATGSKVPNQETRTCLQCKGLGYIPQGQLAAVSNGTATNPPLGEPATFVPAASGPESPEIEALRLRGYTIVPPMQTGS